MSESNESRRSRYQTDPEYRARRLQQCKAYRARLLQDPERAAAHKKKKNAATIRRNRERYRIDPEFRRKCIERARAQEKKRIEADPQYIANKARKRREKQEADRVRAIENAPRNAARLLAIAEARARQERMGIKRKS